MIFKQNNQDFAHLYGLSFKDLWRTIKIEDFENGLDPFDGVLLKTHKIKAKEDLFSQWFYFNERHKISKDSIKNEKMVNYLKKLYQDRHYSATKLLSLFVAEDNEKKKVLKYKPAAEFFIFVLKENLLSLDTLFKDNIPRALIYDYMYENYVELPFLFLFDETALRLVAKHYTPEQLLAVKANLLGEEYNVIDWATLLKGKRKLAAIEEIFPANKKQREKDSIENYLTQLKQKPQAAKNVSYFLAQEIKSHNQELIHYIDNPLFAPALTHIYNDKDLLTHAIEQRNMPLIEKMIEFPVYAKNSFKTTTGTSYIVKALWGKQVEVENYLVAKEFYDVADIPIFAKGPELLFSDSTILTFLKKNAQTPLVDIWLSGYKDSFEYAVLKSPSTLYDNNLYEEIKEVASTWSDPRIRHMWRQYVGEGKYKNRSYVINQKFAPMIISVLKALTIHNDVEKASEIEKNFLSSLSYIETAQTAGYVINCYLKHFPDNKNKVLESLSGNEKSWAIKLGKKDLTKEFDKFLKAAELKIETSNNLNSSALKPKRLNKI